MPSPKSKVEFSGGVYLLLGKQIRSSDSAQNEILNSKENRYRRSDQFSLEIEILQAHSCRFIIGNRFSCQ